MRGQAAVRVVKRVRERQLLDKGARLAGYGGSLCSRPDAGSAKALQLRKVLLRQEGVGVEENDETTGG